MRRVARFFYGIAARIPPHQSGALAQCAFCTWGKFFRDKKRGRYSAVARASSSLRAHARKDHPERFPKFETAEQIFGKPQPGPREPWQPPNYAGEPFPHPSDCVCADCILRRARRDRSLTGEDVARCATDGNGEERTWSETARRLNRLIARKPKGGA